MRLSMELRPTNTACIAWLRTMRVWQVLLRWNVQRGVPVIPRSNTPANIEGNAKGLFDWALTESQKVRAYRPERHAANA